MQDSFLLYLQIRTKLHFLLQFVAISVLCAKSNIFCRKIGTTRLKKKKVFYSFAESESTSATLPLRLLIRAIVTSPQRPRPGCYFLNCNKIPDHHICPVDFATISPTAPSGAPTRLLSYSQTRYYLYPLLSLTVSLTAHQYV